MEKGKRFSFFISFHYVSPSPSFVMKMIKGGKRKEKKRKKDEFKETKREYVFHSNKNKKKERIILENRRRCVDEYLMLQFSLNR